MFNCYLADFEKHEIRVRIFIYVIVVAVSLIDKYNSYLHSQKFNFYLQKVQFIIFDTLIRL